MSKRALPIQERKIDVKCSIPYRLKIWAEENQISFSTMLTGAIKGLANNDQNALTILDLQEIEYFRSRIVEVENRISRRTGKTVETLAEEIPRAAQNQERQSFLNVYRGMNPKGTHPEIQNAVKEIAEGKGNKRAAVVSWLETRLIDFGLPGPAETALKKMLEYKPWESEDGNPVET